MTLRVNSLLKDKETMPISKEIFEEYGKQGVFKQAVSETLGGLGTTYADLHETYRNLGKATCNPSLLLSFQAHVWGGIFPLMKFGTLEQQQKYLPSLLKGKIVAGHAITEVNSGSDIYGILGTVREHGNGFLLNGVKRYITNVSIADFILVYLKDGEFLSGFLLHRDDAGCDFVGGSPMSCFSTSPMGEIRLNECFIPADRLLGQRHAGGQMIQASLELERSFIFSGIVGVMDEQITLVKNYAKKRLIRDLPLSSHQVIQHRVVEMYFRLQILDSLIREAAHLKDQGKRITIQSALIKTFGSQAFLDNSNEAVHILGALGLQDGRLASLVHDALGTRILGGTVEIQKNIVASLIGI